MRFQQFMKNSLLMQLYWDYHSHFKKLQAQLKVTGFNLNEALILLALFFEPTGEATPSDLAQCLQLKKDQISHCLKSLEGHELIEKKLAPGDGRKSLIRITSLGKKRGAELIKIFDSAESDYENLPG